MFQSPPIVVGIGEVLWDLLPSGKQLGGAPANFAYHAGTIGASATVVSRVGDDPLGAEILGRLDAVRVSRSHVGTDAAHPTGTVEVRLDDGGVPQYIIHEPVAWDFIPFTPELRDLAAQSVAVCFGTLAQRNPVSRGAIQSFLAATRPDCLRVLDINLRQHYYSAKLLRELLPLTSLLKLNDDELTLVSRLLGLPDEPDAFAGRLLAVWPIHIVALTRGSAGSRLYSRGEISDHPGFAASVVDTVGAGDAFTAAMVMGLLQGQGLAEVSETANRLAAYVCSQAGAMPPPTSAHPHCVAPAPRG